MAESTWFDRELPILERIYELEEEGHTRIRPPDLREAVDLDDQKLGRTIVLLIENGYVEGNAQKSFNGPVDAFIFGLTGEGRRAVKAWPSGGADDAFLAALDRVIDQTSDEVQRGRLSRIRDSAGEVAKDVMAQVIVLTGQGMIGG